MESYRFAFYSSVIWHHSSKDNRLMGACVSSVRLFIAVVDNFFHRERLNTANTHLGSIVSSAVHLLSCEFAWLNWRYKYGDRVLSLYVAQHSRQTITVAGRGGGDDPRTKREMWWKVKTETWMTDRIGHTEKETAVGGDTARWRKDQRVSESARGAAVTLLSCF